MSLVLRRAAAQSTAARAGVTLVRSTSVAQRRCYQGNLQDKDRIFTNLYNDTSPYLKDAKKRVRLHTHWGDPIPLAALAATHAPASAAATTPGG